MMVDILLFLFVFSCSFPGGVDTEQILIRMRNDIVLLSSALQSKPASSKEKLLFFGGLTFSFCL